MGRLSYCFPVSVCDRLCWRGRRECNEEASAVLKFPFCPSPCCSLPIFSPPSTFLLLSSSCQPVGTEYHKPWGRQEWKPAYEICCVWAVSVGICCWYLPGWEWWGRRCVLIRGHVAHAPFTRFLSELDCLLWLPPASLVPWDGIWPSQGLGASPLGTGAGSCWWGSRPCHRLREAVVLASLTHSEPGHVAHTHLGFENQVSGRTWLSSMVWFLHCCCFFFSFFLEK